MSVKNLNTNDIDFIIEQDTSKLRDVCLTAITSRKVSGKPMVSKVGLKKAGEVFVREVQEKYRTIPVQVIRQAIERGIVDSTGMGKKLTPGLMINWVKDYVVAPSLVPVDKRTVMASMTIQVKDVNIKDLEKKVFKLMTTAIIDTGQNFDGVHGNLGITAKRLTEELRTREPNMTVGQMELAFNNGALGTYGPNPAPVLSKITIWNWIQGFKWHNDRDKALAIQREHILSLMKPKEIPETPQQREERMWEYITKAFYEFTEKGTYQDNFNIAYGYLDEFKLIPLTRSQKIEYTKQALAEMKADMERQLKNPMNQMEPTLIKQLVKQIKSLEPENVAVKAQAKRIALNHFFKSIIDKKLAIPEILKKITP